jgi:predicted dehydrogenase
MGMIGGGEGAFIGPVHRAAAELDGEIRLVCGAFSGDPARSRRSGVVRYGLAADRCYEDVTAMLAREAALPEDERMQFVAIVTPNHLHVPFALAAIDAGFHVICDKPLALTETDARVLADAARAANRLVAVTYNYTGYPMVREARHLVRSGALGAIRRVQCEYLQGWLASEQAHNKQADWRLDPARAGAAGCFGDIGSHCENLVHFVTGLEMEAVCADLSSFVPGRPLDDDGNVLVRFVGGARGVIMASQVAVGEENGLCLRVYGERGGLVWRQQEPNTLCVSWEDRPREERRTGGPGLSAAATAATRLPAGHPEGFLEAFAVIYRNFGRDLRGRLKAAGGPPDAAGQAANQAADHEYPGVEDGVRGMRFLARVVESSGRGGTWVRL